MADTVIEAWFRHCGPQLLHRRAISGSTCLKAQGTHAKTLDVEVPVSDNKRGWTIFGCASFLVSWHEHRHRFPAHVHVTVRPILGGLHHAYWLAEQIA